MKDQTLADAAARFYGLHQGEHLGADSQRLVDRCAEHLRETYDLSEQTARLTAAQAAAEHDTAGTAANINVDATTSRLLVIDDRELGVQHFVPLASVLAMARTHAGR